MHVHYGMTTTIKLIKTDPFLIDTLTKMIGRPTKILFAIDDCPKVFLILMKAGGRDKIA